MESSRFISLSLSSEGQTLALALILVTRGILSPFFAPTSHPFLRYFGELIGIADGEEWKCHLRKKKATQPNLYESGGVTLSLRTGSEGGPNSHARVPIGSSRTVIQTLLPNPSTRWTD
jgi:hypothetical protein